MPKVLPILFAILSLAIGGGAGYALRPVEQRPADETSETHPADPPPEIASQETADADTEFVKLNNQFVIPVVVEAKVKALVVLSTSLEVSAGSTARVYELEPRLRDAFLTVLFDHANSGGFSGEFTAPTKMARLRIALNETARRILGPVFRDVLITDLVRQDT